MLSETDILQELQQLVNAALADWPINIRSITPKSFDGRYEESVTPIQKTIGPATHCFVYTADMARSHCSALLDNENPLSADERIEFKAVLLSLISYAKDEFQPAALNFKRALAGSTEETEIAGRMIEGVNIAQEQVDKITGKIREFEAMLSPEEKIKVDAELRKILDRRKRKKEEDLSRG